MMHVAADLISLLPAIMFGGFAADSRFVFCEATATPQRTPLIPVDRRFRLVWACLCLPSSLSLFIARTAQPPIGLTIAAVNRWLFDN
jgi:hypothetical protein